MYAKTLQLCPTLCDCMNCILSGSSVRGILQARIKISRRNTSNFRYADDTILMAESAEKIKSLLMRVNDESENAGLKLNIIKLRSWHPVPSLLGKQKRKK